MISIECFNTALTRIFIALSAGLLFVSPPTFAKETERFTAKDYYNYAFVTDPQISPDGRKVAYVRRFVDIMSDRHRSDLWIVNFDGSGHRPLTSGLSNNNSPRWSPDGKQIAFVSNRDGKPQIYKLWLDSGEVERLTDLPLPPLFIAWSPDGKYLSYSSHVSSAPRIIATLPPVPPGANLAQPPHVIDRTIYRANRLRSAGGNEKEYFQGYLQLFIMPSEGGPARQLTTGNFNYPDLIRPATPVWTPDGKYILLSVNRRKDWEKHHWGAGIFEINIANGKLKALTEDSDPAWSPAVSVDGKLIAYTRFHDRLLGYQQRQVYVMNRDGSNSRVLTEKLHREAIQISWANDNKGVYFLYDDKGNTKFARVSLDGQITEIARDVGDGRSAYGLKLGGSYTAASNGNFVFTYSRPDHPSDIAVGTAGALSTRIITAVNDDLFANKTLGEVEEIWYESSLDGQKIQAWIMKPPGFDPAKKYPLILEIHGGPHSNYGDRFDIEKQLMASSGYVVFYPNYRGSNSYDEEFSNLIQHKQISDEYYDLMSGVDAVIQKGYIDEDNLFVTGQSAGGMLTLDITSKTHRFNAAAPYSFAVNLFSYVLVTEQALPHAKYFYPGLPWEFPEYYMKNSPITRVATVKTPTMIMAGEDSYWSPIEEMEQYFTALKYLDVETVFVRFPDEGHFIFNRPSHHVSKVQHIIGWFDQHKNN